MSNSFLRSIDLPWRWLLAISLVLLTLHPLPAQEEVLPVEEAEARLVRQWEKSTSGLYFKDINHVLDKFEGTWNGCNADGYELLLKLKAFTKVYDPVYRSHADLLGLQMEIRKDGMTLLAPLAPRHLIPGTDWYRGSRVDWDAKERRADPNAYKFYLNFDNLKSEGYWGKMFVSAHISEDKQTLTIISGVPLVDRHSVIPSYPPYIPRRSHQVAWVLHRVGK